MAIDPNRNTSDRNRRTLLTMVTILAVVALIIVTGGVISKKTADNTATDEAAVITDTTDTTTGSALNAQTPAAGDAGDTSLDPAADDMALTQDDMSEDATTDTTGMTAANDTNAPAVGDTAGDTGTQTATTGSNTCNFSHLVGGTAAEAANVLRQSNRQFYMVTPDVDINTLSETMRNEQVRINVDSSGRVTAVTCPSNM